MIGDAGLSVLTNLCAPDAPADKAYADLMKMLTDHFGKKPETLGTARSTFHRRTQREGELIETWVEDLRRIARDCAFGTSLEERLRDQIVEGARSRQTRRELIKLSVDTMRFTFANTLQTAKDSDKVERDLMQRSLADGPK